MRQGNKAFIAVVCLIFAITIKSSFAYKWIAGAELAKDRAHREAVLVHLDGWLYLAGGLSPTGGLDNLKIFDRYCIADDTWEKLPDLPVYVNHANVAGVAGKIFILGGWGGSSATATGVVTDCYSYDPGTKKFTKIKSMPGKAANAGVAVYDKKVWIFGGSSQSAFDKDGVKTVQVYDPAKDSWEIINSSIPVGKCHIGACVVGDYCYISPGRPPRTGDGTTQRFDFRKAGDGAAAWKKMTPMPPLLQETNDLSRPKKILTGAVGYWPYMDGKCWYMGMEGANSNLANHQIASFKPDGNGGVWKRETPDLPSNGNEYYGRSGHGPVAVGNRIYDCAGKMKSGVQLGKYLDIMVFDDATAVRPDLKKQAEQKISLPSYSVISIRDGFSSLNAGVKTTHVYGLDGRVLGRIEKKNYMPVIVAETR